MTVSPIVDKSQQCLHLIEAIGIAGLAKDEAEKWAEEQQMRLSLFTSKLGVFAIGSLSIDHRLRKNKTVTRALVQILDALLKNLASCRYNFGIKAAVVLINASARFVP